MLLRPQLLLAIGVMNLLSLPCFGAGEARAYCDDCVAVGEWQVNVGLGLGVRTNPLAGEDDTPLVILPEVNYYGERFFLNNFEMGFTLLESERHQLNLVVMPGYDQMYFNRWDPLNFTLNGGVSIASTNSSAAMAGSSSFEVEVRYQEQQITGAPEYGDEEVTDNPGIGTVTPPLQTVQVSDATSVLINGVAVQGGQSVQLVGAGGNTIVVSTSDSGLTIEGIVSGDAVEVVSQGSQSGVNSVITQVQVQDSELAVSQAEPPDALADINWVDELDRRRATALAGVEYTYSLPWLSLNFQAITDVLNVHGGHELRFAATLPWGRGADQFALTLGGNWQSAKVLDYYYGVSSDEAPAHTYTISEGGLTPLARLDWQRSLSEHWSLRALYQFMPLNHLVQDSPFVDGEAVHSVFIGGVYHF